MASNEEFSWSFGLKNHLGNYLTAEAFGFRLNCASKVMKKKQTFTLENEGGKSYIRTHLNRYLSFKADGRVTADAERKGAEEAVSIATLEGKLYISTGLGFYLGGNGDSLDAFTKKNDSADRQWTMQLAIHPQVCIRHVMRKRYVHLSGGQLTTDEDVPWGSDATITINSFDDGRYALQADNGSFLTMTGELKEHVDDSCKFAIEFSRHDFDKICFRGANGKFLTAVGATGTLKAARDEATRDEQFALEDSQPQLKLKNIKFNKFASVKLATEVQCSQTAAGDTECFQFEINKATKQWSIRTNSGKFWSCGADGAITATVPAEKRGPSEWFTVAWLGARLMFTASNGRIVAAKANGSCAALETVATDASMFQFEIINRPKLVLRGEHGFLGAMPSGALECGKSVGDVFSMHVAAGLCHISSSTGKFWVLNDDRDQSVTATGAAPAAFTMEFVEHSKVAIRAPNGKYLQGVSSGGCGATGTAIDASTLWEY